MIYFDLVGCFWGKKCPNWMNEMCRVCGLQHVFVGQTGLTRRLAVELLDKMNNPDNSQHFSEVDDDDLEVLPRPAARAPEGGALQLPIERLDKELYRDL